HRHAVARAKTLKRLPVQDRASPEGGDVSISPRRSIARSQSFSVKLFPRHGRLLTGTAARFRRARRRQHSPECSGPIRSTGARNLRAEDLETTYYPWRCWSVLDRAPR